MLKYNDILKELKDVPANRMDDLYQFVQSLNPKAKKSEDKRKKILAFAGDFRDMSAKDYAAFVKETRKIRAKLFERRFTI